MIADSNCQVPVVSKGSSSGGKDQIVIWQLEIGITSLILLSCEILSASSR
jgi:hypothetical protein